MKRIKAYTDGGCRPNPGVGGWGWVYFTGNEIMWSNYGGEKQSTNNKMELTAVIELLKDLKLGIDLLLYSDSQYVLKGLVKDGNGKLEKSGIYTGWMNNWLKKVRGGVWTAPAKNREYWKNLDKEIRRHIKGGSILELRWVKGHSPSLQGREGSGLSPRRGDNPNEGNEIADRLATKGLKEA